MACPRTPCQLCWLYSLLITPSLLCRLRSACPLGLTLGSSKNSVFKPSSLVDVSFAGAVVSSCTKCFTPCQPCWLYSLLITPCRQCRLHSFRMLYLSSRLFVPLRAWAGTAHSPALNSIAKVRACVCNAKRFEKFLPALQKKFLISCSPLALCKDFFAVKIVEEVKYPIKKGLRLNINN